MPSPTSQPAAQSVSRRQYHPQNHQLHQKKQPAAVSGPRSDAEPHHYSQARSGLPPFRLPFQSSSTSASLAPSVAKGKPIPVDDTTAEHRTEALRELNSHYPSRHRYAKSTGAQNTTYSEPVIVRSYYRPTPSRSSRMSHGGNSGGIVVVRNGPSTAGSINGSVASRTRSSPFAGKMASASRGMLGIMAKARGANAQPAASVPEDAKLPPLEAFTFKSFLENLDEQEATGSSSDINADLDRIAEICARSRYSLSNQYEVHYGPHGSGNAFMAEGQQPPESHGPTLQAVTSDDEGSSRTQQKRQFGNRRNSRAMGTLETIMSSSRSSEDDPSRKKSAAELADEVRGRASTKTSQRTSQHTSPAASTASARESRSAQSTPKRPSVKRTPSSSLALIEAVSKNAASPCSAADPSSASHRTSVASLLAEPAVPQPCNSQMQVHTGTSTTDTPTAAHLTPAADGTTPTDKPGSQCPCLVARGAVSSVDDATASGLLSALAGWIPWSGGSPDPAALRRDRAVGSLRNLLKTAGGQPDHE